MVGRTAAARSVRLLAALTDLIGGRRLGPRVLIYHEIGGQSGRELNVAPGSFRSQLDWMAAHGRVVGLEEAIGRVADSSLSDHFVLTFDDGYAGVWTHAFPLLRERGWPFTIYLTTHPIESQKSLFDAGDRPLTWDQIATMMETGLVTVGAHTHTHPDLRNSSDDRTIEELSLSDDLIEQRLGRLPQHFAYPWGYWSPQAHRLVRARYTSAALGSGPADVTGLAEGSFHRIPVMASDGPLLFRRRMFGGFRLEDQMRRLVKGYDGL